VIKKMDRDKKKYKKEKMDAKTRMIEGLPCTV
jgi:hypothetical protein